MGDRSNIVVEHFDGSRIYLYSHWGGETIIKSALHGLKSGRADDPAYLARIIFEHMIRNDAGSLTGYGISAVVEDNEHPLLVISNAGTGPAVWFEETLSGKTPVAADGFVDLVNEVTDWTDLAEQNELYDVLISKISEGKA